MDKTYRTISSISYQVQVIINGNRRYIDFTGGTRYPKLIMAYYRTSDPKEQEALEASPSFNRSFVLEETRKEVVKAGVEEEKEMDTKVFNSINEAKEFLMSDPYNIPRIKLPNLAAVENKAKSLGFNFVIENSNK